MTIEEVEALYERAKDARTEAEIQAVVADMPKEYVGAYDLGWHETIGETLANMAVNGLSGSGTSRRS